MKVINLINTLSSSTQVRVVNRCGEVVGYGQSMSGSAKWFRKQYSKQDVEGYCGTTYERQKFLNMNVSKHFVDENGIVIIYVPVGETPRQRSAAEKSCIKKTGMTRSQLSKKRIERHMLQLAAMTAIIDMDGPYGHGF